MSGFNFDDDNFDGPADQTYDNLDYTGGSNQDYGRTSNSTDLAFERRDLYNQSLEDRLMIAVRSNLGTYNFGHDRKTIKIEEAIDRHKIALKQSNPELIITATIFLYMYEKQGGLTKANFANFETKSDNRHKDKKLDLIRYIRFLNTLGMEVHS